VVVEWCIARARNREIDGKTARSRESSRVQRGCTVKFMYVPHRERDARDFVVVIRVFVRERQAER